MKKLALLLPGTLDSPDYLHMNIFEKELNLIDYDVIKIDPCNIWKGGGDIKDYTVTNYIKQIKETISSVGGKYSDILLLGHSSGGFVAIVSAALINQVTKVVALCPPARRDNIRHKWNKDGFKISKRELPDNPTEFNSYQVPISYVDDASQYSAIESAKLLKSPLLLVICEQDDEVDPREIEQICIPGRENIKLIRIARLGHNFRRSKDETNIVWDSIKSFIRQ